MGYVRKRGSSWTAEVRKGGQRLTATFDSKSQAQNWISRTEADIADAKYSTIPDKIFGDLLEKYRKEVTPTKRGKKWEETRIGLFLRDELAQVHLRDLDQTHFAVWRDRRLRSVSEASVLREWNILSNACKRALQEWKWLESHPMKGVEKPTKPPSRDRIYTDEEIGRLMHSMGTDLGTVVGRVGAAFLFALETAMRCGEICGLTWDRVNLEKRFLVVMEGKTRAAKREIPLSQKAIDILESLPKHEKVFNLGESTLDMTFRRAKQKALIMDATFHDSRATAITRLAKKLDILSLARMVGHKDLRMLQIYYRESAEDIAKRL